MLGGAVGGVESIPQVAASPKNRGSLVVQEDDKLGTSWGRSKTGWLQSLQKDFLSHLHPCCLLFPEYEMRVFRKALADM